jgi:hypothetical protein
MPQPLTENQSEGTYWRWDSLEERPACAAGVAKVASYWAFLEFSLIMMFFQATGDPEWDDFGEVEIVGHQLAFSTLSVLESTTAKLDVIAAGIASCLPGKSAAFDQLRKGIGSCARERNRIVHAVWGVNKVYPDHIIRVEKFDHKFIKYTLKDFDDVAQRIKEQIDAVSAFDADCRAARTAELPPKQRGQPQ